MVQLLPVLDLAYVCEIIPTGSLPFRSTLPAGVDFIVTFRGSASHEKYGLVIIRSSRRNMCMIPGEKLESGCLAIEERVKIIETRRLAFIQVWPKITATLLRNTLNFTRSTVEADTRRRRVRKIPRFQQCAP